MLLASLVLAATPASMTHLRADILYTLKQPDGRAAPSPMPRVWYFEVPKKRSDDASMNELLHRIFWDQNVALRAREPNDHAYLAMVSFKTSKVDKAAVKASKGVDERAFGWFEANRAITSEPSATFIVDEQGRYDNIGVHDYTELLLHRMFDAGEVTEAEFVAFFDAYTNGAIKGRVRFDGRVKRLAALTRIGPTVTDAPGSGSVRKAPGQKPFVSGPIDAPTP